ncbi:MAG TPA: glycosyltransferase [Verrucomicrobiae bacterium]|nr:glycosyltransferase [Verrucomicrobiae bacterium]
MANSTGKPRLLVFNCHEAWVHQLRALDQPMDVVIGLPGRHTRGWDEAMRPIPPNARMVRIEEAVGSSIAYDCVIAHNLSDLLDAKTIAAPRLLVIHGTLESAVVEQGSRTPPHELRGAVARYVEMIGAHVMAVTRLKGESWGFGEDVVRSFADVHDYLPFRGDLARGLRVANDVLRKQRTLLWDFHLETFAGIPVTLVGRNGEMPGILPARDWADLKEIFSQHRFFVHTADPRLEDGFNMATLEAMAAGMPVLGNRHPTSPVEHGVSGFLSDHPAELRRFARLLLEDRELAARMGREAQRAVAKKFSREQFKRGLERAIERARRKFQRRLPIRAAGGS